MTSGWICAEAAHRLRPLTTQQAEQPTSVGTTSVGTGATDSDGDIVVSARHRNESSQGVPVAISIVGGDHIDSTGAFNVGRLQQLTPALQFYSSNSRNTSVNVRGVGSPLGLTNDGIDQGVGIYVDDVYYSRVVSSTFNFLDVKQIEVLRGPQGTLYGKNTTAGAINFTSRQPTFTPEARAEVSSGNDASGQRLPGVSKYALSFGGEANLPIAIGQAQDEIYFGADGNTRTKFSSNATPSPSTDIQGYTLRLDVYAWVRNAFDKGTLEQLQIAPNSVGLVVGNLGDPRTFGGTVKIQF